MPYSALSSLAAAPVHDTMDLSQARVLVVDDHPVNRTLLRDVVSGLGVTGIETAAHGFEGLEKLASFQPDLILLDVMMPRMDGLTMCQEVRKIHPQSQLPILFVTALTSPQERAKCLAVGGTDVVAKPFYAPELMSRIRVHLENRMLLMRLQEFNRRVEHELAIARSAQELLLPDDLALAQLGQKAGLKIEGLVEASSELGGDFWTAFELPNQQLGLLMVDFAGHGVGAAINVFRLHAMLRQLPPSDDPSDWLRILNRALFLELRSGQFATALYGIMDGKSGQFRYAGAAAPSPILLQDRQARYLDASGPPLGAFRDAVFENRRVHLPPGGSLVLYSDALVESTLDGQLVCSEEALLRWVEQCDGAPAGSLIAPLFQRFRRHFNDALQDDLTLISLRRPW